MKNSPLHTMLLLSLVSANLIAAASAAKPFPDQELHGRITLDKQLVVSAGRLEIADGTVIVTHGYPLIITCAGDLNIKGVAKIEAFEADVYSNKPAKPVKAAVGVPGTSYDPGPNSEGRAPAEGGTDGGNGGEGAPGKSGAQGASAGPITITVVGRASGELKITNEGTLGCDGGDGGDGGLGGNGQQGGRGVPNEVGFGIALGAAKGPGGGGKAGDGGRGGKGGDGGNGGAGGAINIGVAGDVSGFRVTKCTYKPGAGGKNGEGGTGGDPGTPGFGGRGAKGVEGRENERKGAVGVKGPSGAKGATGTDGGMGSINFRDQPFLQDQ